MHIRLLFTIFLATLFCSCNSGTNQHQEAQEYKLLNVENKNTSVTNSYSAAIKGQQDIKVIPRVDGYLTDILIKEGDKVSKGQPLFIIDQVPFKMQLQAAQASVAICKANLDNAQLNYNSKKSLFEKNIVSEYDMKTNEIALESAKAQLLQAQANEVFAQNNLSYTVIKSPSNGVIGKIHYRKGDYVGPSTQNGLTVVADTDIMYVYFSMHERNILDMISKHANLDNAIANMPEVELVLSNGATYKNKGKIESISGIVDENTGAVSVRAAFDNKERLLLSGGAGTLLMPYEYSQAIVIPQEATYEVQNKTFVYKVIDGKAVAAIVEINKINNGKEYIVTDGLTKGDVIIAEGAGLVREGTQIKIQ